MDCGVGLGLNKSKIYRFNLKNRLNKLKTSFKINNKLKTKQN